MKTYSVSFRTGNMSKAEICKVIEKSQNRCSFSVEYDRSTYEDILHVETTDFWTWYEVNQYHDELEKQIAEFFS